MTAGRTNTMKVGTKIGAGIGVLVFLVFGIVPGFYFGSYGTLVLLEPSGRRACGTYDDCKDADSSRDHAGHILCRGSEHSAWFSVRDSHGLCS